MGKKRQHDKRAAEPATDSAAPFNSAFSGLAGLREALPKAPASADGAAPLEATDAGDATKALGRVVLQREKKGRGGKTVLRVRGIPADHGAWAKRLKKRIGCGAVVEDEDVVLLGDVGDAAQAFFEAQGARVVRGN